MLQGANVTETVGSGLVLFPDGGGLSAAASIVALVTAAVLVAVGIFTGYPIATAFTVTGAVVGVGLAMGGQPAVAKYTQIAALWVAVPFVGSGMSYALAWSLRHERVPERLLVPGLAGLVGAVLANVEFVLLAPGDEQASVARAAARALGAAGTPTMVAITLAVAAVAAGLLYRDVAVDPAAGQRHFLLVLGGLVAFSAGGEPGRARAWPSAPGAGRGTDGRRAHHRRPAVRWGRPPGRVLDRRAADDKDARTGLLLARPTAVHRGAHPEFRRRTDRRLLWHPRLVQRDHRLGNHRVRRGCGRRRGQRGEDGQDGAGLDRVAGARVRPELGLFRAVDALL